MRLGTWLRTLFDWLTFSRRAPQAATEAEAWSGRFAQLNQAKATGKIIMRECTDWERLVAELATGLWRLKQRLTPPDGERPRDELRRAFRDVESLWDTLLQAGVEVLDHTGALYDPGQSLTVLAFQPTTGIDRERIVETVKPTVYYKGNWLRMGEVIVGTPAAALP